MVTLNFRMLFSLVLQLQMMQVHAVTDVYDPDFSASDLLRSLSLKLALMLRQKLLANYDPLRVPIDPSSGQPINVTLDFWPYDILYLVCDTFGTDSNL